MINLNIALNNLTIETKKLRNFNEPMSNKEIECIPGIGEKNGIKLRKKNYDKADVLLGQFLILKKNEELFIDYLKDIGINRTCSKQCFDALKSWCDEFL